ncbi:unnamed protein product [Candidula unifasciata]|uniref:Uncharacterized protein n=1 Tax=Candidula unifasciata TaxID=100452 RepID=A0A8S3YLW7_9EUPU|nr:unnamed protein product [Candidula unifasciata]
MHNVVPSELLITLAESGSSMDDTSGLGGRSFSPDVASNVSMITTPESDAFARDEGDIVSPARLEQEVEGSEHELCGLGQQEKTDRSFSELSIGAAWQDDIGEIQNETWATSQNEAGVAQDGVGTTTDQAGAIQDEPWATREETEAVPQEETGVAQDGVGTTKDEAGATPDETGAIREEIEATPQDESDDNNKIKPVSPDFKIEDRPQSQKSLTGTDRKSAQQEELTQDVLSGNHSSTETLSTSRQSQGEDVTSIRSADGSSLNASDSQYHTRSGSPAGCCCEQPGELAKDELDAESGNVEVVATSIVIETAQSPASLEPRSESRLSSQDEPNVDKVGDAQLNNEELGGVENTIPGQCCQQEAVDDVLRIQSPEEAKQLKAEITSLQTRLQTLTKDNSEKGMRIVALESNLLEMTAKLLDAEKKYVPVEVSPSKRETSKSRTCAIL